MKSERQERVEGAGQAPKTSSSLQGQRDQGNSPERNEHNGLCVPSLRRIHSIPACSFEYGIL